MHSRDEIISKRSRQLLLLGMMLADKEMRASVDPDWFTDSDLRTCVDQIQQIDSQALSFTDAHGIHELMRRSGIVSNGGNMVDWTKEACRRDGVVKELQQVSHAIQIANVGTASQETINELRAKLLSAAEHLGEGE